MESPWGQNLQGDFSFGRGDMMSELLTIGEPLVVLCSTDPDSTIQDSVNFNKVIGGAELNVAVGTRRLNHSVDYIGQVGDDPQGDFIRNELNKRKINTDYLMTSKEFYTGYQMKQLVSQGDPFVFNFRKGSAASHIDQSIIEKIDYSDTKIIHLTGIFPASSSDALGTSILLAQKANKSNITLTFDPNLRPALWTDKETMVKTINKIASYADIVLPGQNEGKILTGYDDPEKIADFYLQGRAKAVFVKTGAKGSYVKTKDGHSAMISGFKVKEVVDTVGAGDGYALGVITALLENKSYDQAAKRGNAIGSLQVRTHGDNDGYPMRNELDNYYLENGVEE